ncbi:tRNA-2-methylthio-N6-dimethylallyladenosine synthase [Parelusimicrobium proximum]|uniref:tRNA (N6-isopentenyl adenosine(37)-C2)-methylthiotransferase MiaB n=1 Tax=Parelusimicrobium proximum TaxID=3228953 RepID=UPI003D181382
MKKVFIKTFGCQMNTADSLEMLSALNARGITEVFDMEEADIVLVNTCTVREHAEHRAVSFLGRLAKWKKNKKGRVIIFAGCAAERLGEELKKDFPHLDIVAGAKSIDKFADILDARGVFGGAEKAEGAGEGLTAYVTVMRGCDFACSYCIVPSVRGTVVCLAHEDILREIKEKAAAGAKEIVLLGQTVNAYKYGDIDFADLLERAALTDGVERVRFMSPHPAFITDKLIDVISANPKIAKHIHIPVQSGSTDVLKSMKRGYTRESLEEKLLKLKAKGIALSTDIIVGYPSETEEDFNKTLDLCDKIGFTFAYCFKFSPRAGTEAYAMVNTADGAEVEKRLNILLNKVKENSVRAYADARGTNQLVLMESEHKGRASTNLWVKTKKAYKKGDIINVFIEDIKGTILISKE